MVDGRCMTCRENVTMNSPKQHKTETGRDIIKGVCPKCGKVVCRMGKM